MCFLWEKGCVSSIIVSCIKEEGQAIALLPYTVLLCNLSSVLLGICLHFNFSEALVSLSLAATSALEMEDLSICISSLFAFFSLFFPSLFLISACFQEQRESGHVLGAQKQRACSLII